MGNKKKPDNDWHDPALDPDSETEAPPARRAVPRDDWGEYAEWREERGSRGRKRRDKAGGRHQKIRRRETEDS